MPVFVEIFLAFLKLGCVSFGGPTAHMGFFSREFVQRRRWIDEAAYIDLISLCHFLPGPSSSQVGFSIGLLRGGNWLGGFAAWLGFTLPSIALLIAAAYGMNIFAGTTAANLMHGLKLVAVAVVAHALWVMAQGLRAERARILIALAAILIIMVAGMAVGQIIALGCGALVGLRYCKPMALATAGALSFPVTRPQGNIALILTAMLFVLPPLFFAPNNQAVALFEVFFHAGSLVFGGGHVVLPLLQTELVTTDWISNETFLTGYGLVQAMPGPLFALAAFLGAAINGMSGAIIALAGIFLPGLLLVYGVLPYWDRLRERDDMQAAMRGITAAVTGMLAIAFYANVLTPEVQSTADTVLAAAGFAMLAFWKLPSWLVAVLMIAAAVAQGLMA